MQCQLTSDSGLAISVSHGLVVVLGCCAEAGPDVLLWVQEDDVDLGAEQDHQAHHGRHAGGRGVKMVVAS